MIRHRTLDEVRRFTWFKIITLIIMILLLLVLSLRGCGSTNGTTDSRGGGETAVSPTTAVESASPSLAAPNLTSPAANDTLTSGSTVTLTGTGTPGSQIHIRLNNADAGTTDVRSDGTWSLDITTPDADTLTVALTASDASGAEQNATPTLFNLVPPLAAPTLTLPATDQRVGTVTLSGTGTPGSTVAVMANGVAVGTAVVAPDGTWTFNTEFTDAGDVELSVSAVDAAGSSAAGASAILTLAPAITAPELALPANINLIAGRTIPVTGSGTPGSTLEIIVNGEVVGTAVVAEDGTWTFDFTPENDGDIAIQARALNPDGSIAAEGPEQSVTIAPPRLDSLAVAERTGNFTTLLAAIDAAGLTDTLQGDGPFTIFAPTDDAFARLPEGMVEALLANPEVLAQVLAFHVVAGEVDAEAVTAAESLDSLAELPIPVSVNENGRVQVQYSAVSRTDVVTSNGIIHVIDRVMLPPLVTPPVIDESGVPIFAGGLLTVVGDSLPETVLLLEVNDDFFGETIVQDDGFWLIADDVTAGDYLIIAYALADDGTPLAMSKPVFLVSP